MTFAYFATAFLPKDAAMCQTQVACLSLMIVITSHSAAESFAAEPTVGDVVKFSFKPAKGRSIATVVGEVELIDDDFVHILNLKNERREVIRRSEMKALTISPSDQEMIPILTPSQIFSYRYSKSQSKSEKRGKIAATDGRGIYLNVGKGSGIKTGDEYKVYRIGAEIKDPETKSGSIPNGQWMKVRIEVTVKGKSAKLKASLEKDTLFEWSGDVDDLDADKRWSPPNKKQLSISVLRSRMGFRNLKVVGGTLTK